MNNSFNVLQNVICTVEYNNNNKKTGRRSMCTMSPGLSTVQVKKGRPPSVVHLRLLMCEHSNLVSC